MWVAHLWSSDFWFNGVCVCICFNLPGKEPGLFDLIIINNDLEEAYTELKNILAEVSYFTSWEHSSLSELPGYFLGHGMIRFLVCRPCI